MNRRKQSNIFAVRLVVKCDISNPSKRSNRYLNDCNIYIEHHIPEKLGLKPVLNIIDNVTYKGVKKYQETENIKLQLLESHNHHVNAE